MKILYIIDSLGGGGAEKLLRDILIRRPKGKYCEVLILTSENDKYSAEIVDAGVKIIEIPHKTHFMRIKFIIKYVKINKFDIIHAHLFPCIYYCAIAKMICGNSFPTIVMTEHSTGNKRRNIKAVRFFEKIIYNTYSKVISISEMTQKNLVDWITPKDINKYVIIENGIDVDKFATSKQVTREEMGVKEEDYIIMMIGSFTPHKNHCFMIDIIADLPSNCKLVCIGEGPLLNEIETQIEKNKVSNRVRLLGFKHDVARYIKASDVVVIPSTREGFGLVAVEAMACGRPIVVSDVPGLREVVGDVGIRCKLESKSSFIDALLAPNNNTNQLLSAARRYDICKTTAKYFELYKTICNE